MFDHDASAAGADVADRRILTTVGWQTSQEIAFALEGIIRSCGDAINWFSEQVAPLPDVAEICQEVLTSDSQEDIYFIPALQGMGAPFWDNTMTASFVGMKRTTTTHELLKAVLKASFSNQSSDRCDGRSR